MEHETKEVHEQSVAGIRFPKNPDHKPAEGRAPESLSAFEEIKIAVDALKCQADRVASIGRLAQTITCVEIIQILENTRHAAEQLKRIRAERSYVDVGALSHRLIEEIRNSGQEYAGATRALSIALAAVTEKHRTGGV